MINFRQSCGIYRQNIFYCCETLFSDTNTKHDLFLYNFSDRSENRPDDEYCVCSRHHVCLIIYKWNNRVVTPFRSSVSVLHSRYDGESCCLSVTMCHVNPRVSSFTITVCRIYLYVSSFIVIFCHINSLVSSFIITICHINHFVSSFITCVYVTFIITMHHISPVDCNSLMMHEYRKKHISFKPSKFKRILDFL